MDSARGRAGSQPTRSTILRRVKAKAESYPNFEKLEFLPFHKLCIEKYDRLGLEFPLRDTPAMTNERLSELLAQL